MAAARQFGEVLAAELGHRTGVRLPAGDQPARLDLLSRAGVLAPRVLDASDLSVLAQRVAALEEDLPRLRHAFDLRVSPVTLAVAEREQLIVSARDAAYEPLRESDIAAEVQRRLAKAGWDVLGAGEETQLNRSLGCVLVEPRLAGGLRADMLLTVGGQVVGIVECKRDGTDLTDAMEQADALAEAPAGSLPWPVWRSPPPYRYVSDGQRLLFCDANDPA